MNTQTENSSAVVLPVPTDSESRNTFHDRRTQDEASSSFERRQFGNTHALLSPDARELAEAIDAYKVLHRRRYITFEEMLRVIHTLGYQKSFER